MDEFLKSAGCHSVVSEFANLGFSVARVVSRFVHN